jgi:hypothetical protein
MKVVYNNCYGGFGLSHKAVMRYAELKGMKVYPFVTRDGWYKDHKQPEYVPYVVVPGARDPSIIHYSLKPDWTGTNEDYWLCYRMERDDPILVQVVEELGEEADGHCAKLAIEDVPKGMKWKIDEYDGNESVVTEASYADDWKIAT